jgi:thymidylate synthase (FAD)
MMYIPVEDGFVELIDWMVTNPAQKTARSARVSSGNDLIEYTPEQDAKLVRFLANHNPPHTSPFRHSPITVLFEAPHFVKMHIYKHLIGSEFSSKDTGWNEQSQRYTIAQKMWIPDEFHGQTPGRKQGGSNEVHPNNSQWRQQYIETLTAIQSLYDSMIADGIAREEARAILPMATYTRWYMTATMQTFVNLCSLRVHPDAQRQTQAYASAVEAICLNHYGFVWDELMKRYRHG